MKGTVFVELLSMAEEAFGEEVVDDILDTASLSSDGVYTAVGNYPCSDLVTLVTAFSDHSGVAGDELQRMFGHWMLKNFGKSYPEFFKDKTDSFSMLEAIDGEIHVEVRKLYPEAELPRFTTRRTANNTLEMDYASPRPLAPFCHGLIEATTAHFNQDADITMRAGSDPSVNAHFEIRLRDTPAAEA